MTKIHRISFLLLSLLIVGPGFAEQPAPIRVEQGLLQGAAEDGLTVHGAISQSGGSFGPPRPTAYPGENMKRLADAEQSGLAYAKRAGAASIAEVRKFTPDKLPARFGGGAAWPIIDGWVIPNDQYKLYEVGKYNDVAILVGYNSDEGLSFSREKTPEEFRSNVEKRYGPFAEKLFAAYPVGTNSVPKTARDPMRDAAFGRHTWSWARLEARTGKSKVFCYYFDQHPERGADSPQADHGTPHGVEVPYVFQTLDRTKPDITQRDLQISDAVATYWVNFAKQGDPNGAGVPTLAAVHRERPSGDVFQQDTSFRPCAERLCSRSARHLFRLAPHAGR